MKERTLYQTIQKFLEPFYVKPRPYIESYIQMFSFAFYSIVIILFSQQITEALELKDRGLFIELIYIYVCIFIFYQLFIFLIKELGWVNSHSEFSKTTYARYLAKYITFDNNYIETVWTWKSVAIISKWTRTWWRLLDTVTMNLSYLTVWLWITIYMLYQVSGYLLIAFLILFILSFYLWHLLNKNVLFERNKRNRFDNLTSKYLVKILMSKFEILQSNKIKKEINNLYNLESWKEECNRKMSTSLIFFFMVPEILMGLSSIVIFLYFWEKYFIWEVKLSLLVWMVSSLIIIQKVLWDTMRALKDFTKEFSEVTTLWDFFDNAPQIQWYEEGNKFSHKKWEINIEKLNFWYVDWKNIFTNFSLKIEWEKVLALVWDSGSGKSTLAKMVAGYMRPNSWEIIIDKQKLSETSLKSYYKDIWYLTQDPSVFDGSILENLTYALEEKVSDEKIKEIIIQARCEFIYDLPNGLDTQIWERWVKLSGGQKQRLAIAKIFLKDPKIIILDEPTSALDSFSEEQITKAMQNLFENRTVIVIAHRLQTVKHAHRILVLENWKILEDWNHESLVKKEWKYAKMLELQSGF